MKQKLSGPQREYQICNYKLGHESSRWVNFLMKRIDINIYGTQFENEMVVKTFHHTTRICDPPICETCCLYKENRLK